MTSSEERGSLIPLSSRLLVIWHLFVVHVPHGSLLQRSYGLLFLEDLSWPSLTLEYRLKLAYGIIFLGDVAQRLPGLHLEDVRSTIALHDGIVLVNRHIRQQVSQMVFH